MYYQQLPGTNSGPESSYDAAYPFGAGLSYTSHDVASIVGVSDSGDRAGEMVVPVYVAQPSGDVLAPPRKLVAFARVHLDAGQSRTVVLDVPPSRLAVTPGDIDGSGSPQVARGDYVFTAGGQSTTVTLR